MSQPAVPQPPLSVEEYLELEETGGRRHEHVAGEIHAHAGETSRHNALAANVLAAPWNAARGGPCRVYGSDMMLRAAEEVFYDADVTVVRGDDEAGDAALHQDAPCLVVGVTSPSTASIDRREKMLAYRHVPALKTYLIVDQEMMRVERRWRDETGRWRRTEAVGPDGIVPVPCPETGLTPPEIYKGLL